MNQSDIRFDPNQSENVKYNLISVWFNKISKRFRNDFEKIFQCVVPVQKFKTNDPKKVQIPRVISSKFLVYFVIFLSCFIDLLPTNFPWEIYWKSRKHTHARVTFPVPVQKFSTNDPKKVHTVKSNLIKPKSDCIYYFPIDLEPKTSVWFQINRCMVNTI